MASLEGEHMSNPNKRKGTVFESAVRDYLNTALPDMNVYRPAQAGAKDTGDLHGLPGMVVQCKAYKDVTAGLREGVAGAKVQAVNAGVPFGVAVVKRPRKLIGEAYVVMELADFVRLLDDWHGRAGAGPVAGV